VAYVQKCTNIDYLMGSLPICSIVNAVVKQVVNEYKPLTSIIPIEAIIKSPLTPKRNM